MNTPAPKTTSSALQPQKGSQPFFQKEGQGAFFSPGQVQLKAGNDHQTTSPFFGGQTGSTPFFTPSRIQPKPATSAGRLTIGQPNDKYEQEADAMVDQVAQQVAVDRSPLSVVGSAAGVQRECTECGAEGKEQALAPELQLFPGLSEMLPGLGDIDWGAIISSLGTEVISNLHLPVPEIPFPFSNPFELPLPWPVLPDIDPWEIIREIINYLRNILNPAEPLPGGGGAGPAIQNPLANMSTFQSPGGSGWRGAIFGCYRNACTRPHRGWDLHAPAGTDTFAIESGTVSHHQNPGGYGDYIFLTAGTRRYRYAHLSARQPAGQYNAGATIGQTGVTGNANASRPHLHLEVQQNNAAVDPAGTFATPTNVRAAANPFAITAINFAEPENCNPCAM